MSATLKIPTATVILSLHLAAPALAADVDVENGRISAITLSSGGMAEIQRSASIDGAETWRIEVPLEQIDDILKSLLVRDTIGKVQSVTLDGPSPVEETFRRLPFTPQQLGSLPELSSSLQGVRVKATSGQRTIQGAILGAQENVVKADGEQRKENILSVMTADGQINVLRLGPDTVFDVLDPGMKEKIREAAAVSGRGKTENVRTISIDVTGNGHREIRLSYVVPAPVWKTAYRLVTRNDGPARLQAWAVIENASGEDWKDVQLTLASGAPVTLSQHLYQRYWSQCPEVPISAGMTAPPRPDTANAVEKSADRADGAIIQNLRRKAFGTARAPTVVQDSAVSAEMAAPAPPAEAASVQEGETTATYALPSPITIGAGQTLSLPFVDSNLPTERISLFQPERNDPHPVSGVYLENKTAASLPPGILTVYD